MDGNVCLLSVLLSFFSFLFAVSKKHKPSSNTFFYGFVFTNPVELEVVQTMSSHTITELQNKWTVWTASSHWNMLLSKDKACRIWLGGRTSRRGIERGKKILQTNVWEIRKINWASSGQPTSSKLGRYLSNRPQVSMVSKLINHAGCFENTRRILRVFY